jgi:hypothetical protein
MRGCGKEPVSGNAEVRDVVRLQARYSPVQTCKHLDFLRAQVPSFLIFIPDCVHRLELALATTSDTRPGTFNALVDPISLYAENVQLCVCATDMKRVGVLSS